MESTSLSIVRLHGDLDLEIIEACHLPNMDLISKHIRGCLTACCFSIPSRSPQGHSHPRPHSIPITSDPYVAVRVAGATVARTRVISNTQSPVWGERFKIPLAHLADALEFLVKDNDFLGAELIGTARISASRLVSAHCIYEWLPIVSSSGRPLPLDPALYVRARFVPVAENPLYVRGIPGDPEELGVRDAYFPLRKGGRVTLYQDAHVRDGEIPDIKLEGGRVFRQGKCWEDMCQAILEAQKLIYVVGWSINHKVRLMREPTRRKHPEDLTLGELLKYKSQEGVRVCLLVWDDKTSHDKSFFKTQGVMQTNDEETRKFFKHSSVYCVLSPRYASNKLSMVKQQVVGTLYTHHQKCLLVDTKAYHSTMRKITAFIGGLDLCKGRYDTPEHRLFNDLDSVFLDDIHNPTFDVQAKGPREPWHDLHCKIEGPAAYDILLNFEQCWQKATNPWSRRQGVHKITPWRDDALIKLYRIPQMLIPSSADGHGDPNVWFSGEDDSEDWHVQVFRSIDSGSVKGFPNTVHEAVAKNLFCGKNLVIDKSIQTAYINAIRSAQHFIYIENQYFIGSSYGWPSYKNAAGADNLIPMELALKIVGKIREGVRFSVYIVIPMWPEGSPTSSSVQEILFWQGETMKMMYQIIGQELRSLKFENAHPQDYLNFYCLGNRELSMDRSPPSENDAAAMSQKYRRFMIYVHGKGMIVDDEYVILGSANVNQRSLDGSRDTEIAMGAYQPHHTWEAKKAYPHGQVYGYRRSLWTEHLGQVDTQLVEEPDSLECVKFVNQIAEDNWARYTTTEVIPLQGHLLKYPINVDAVGNVSLLPGFHTFPDVGGNVLGEPTPLPDELTIVEEIVVDGG
ncbi:phospholipase D delta-like isoform X1 [Typha latifolia]|uniref:phospholipase D delta-like isoform X1 n=1 Tax=Typha latifolia TaxID=4733 RepID=UPI003C2F20CF